MNATQERAQRIAFVVFSVIAAGFAFYATERHPYNYYVLTRWIVFLTCAFGIWVWRNNLENGLTGPLCILTGLIFNPIMSFHFKRTTWFWMDIAAGVALLICAVTTWRMRRDDDQLDI